MLDITFAGSRYRAASLNAFDQFACLQAMMPLMLKMQGQARSRQAPPPSDRLGLIMQAVEGLEEGAMERLCALCLTGVEREDGEDSEAWVSVWDSDEGDTPFEDLGTVHILSLTARVIFENLRAYLLRKRAEFDALGEDPPHFDPVELPDGLSWLLRPVERGLCRYESLKDGTLDLADIALMNEALSATAENESRARKAAKESAQ